MRFFKNILNISIALLTITTFVISCEKPQPSNKGNIKGGIILPGEGGHRLILYYGAGKNTLESYLKEDIQDMTENYIPMNREIDNVVLMYTRLGENRADQHPSPSYLIRVYRDYNGSVIKDTLHTYSDKVNAADPNTLNMVLEEVKERFPDRKYGLVFSSHGSGWLPNEYLQKPEGGTIFSTGIRKSIGQDAISYNSYEIDIRDFAKAIPMHLDYIIFDACFMGGIEVAYELRYTCENVIFSQTEILGDGFNYKKIINTLLMTPKNYLEKVCDEYYKQYEDRTGWEKSATVSMVQTRNIETLARTCKKLIDKHKEGIKALNRFEVQRYFRYADQDYFFDLADILIKSGATNDEISELAAALDGCIKYKAATKQFMPGYSGFDINIYSGLSMYIPDTHKPKLNQYYKTLEWNISTNLVD